MTKHATDMTAWPQWLREADTLDARVNILENGRVIWLGGTWFDGAWHGGEWYGGYWYSGLWLRGNWYSGTWRDGEWRNGIWHSGTWYDGTWHGHHWLSGEWHNGYWHRGIWASGYWHDGIWRGGEWRGGYWHGGTWRDGEWRGGTWHNGVWHDGKRRGGYWQDGTWHNGTWHGGTWHNGTWNGGTWNGGEWHGGQWRDARIDRLLFMAARIGIVFDSEDYATAYRSTGPDGEGRWTSDFHQAEGEYYETDVPPAGSGTCVRGIHVCSQATALTYFGIEPTAQLWQVRFHRNDLLDCDGQQARIRGGTFTRIPWTFYTSLKEGETT